ncbi:hypothetical protein B0H11DRAFT_2225402 [Mycena galericulata]|nr:hypothetical protein B0H11DRAFT_2225402 [Mycena galericulata]
MATPSTPSTPSGGSDPVPGEQQANVRDAVSLFLKREAMAQGGMTAGLRIWLDLSIFNDQKATSVPVTTRVKGSFMKRKKAEWALRKNRVDLLMKRRSAVEALRHTPAGRTRLRLLHIRPVQPTLASPRVSKEADILEGRRVQDLMEARRVRDLRMAHLLKLRDMAKGKRERERYMGRALKLQ